MNLNHSLTKLLGSTLLVSIPGKFLALAMTIMIARTQTPELLGLFTFAQGFALVASQFACLGWPTLMHKYVPIYCQQREWPLLKGLLLRAEQTIIASSVFLTMCTLVAAGSISVSDQLELGLILGALLLPILSLKQLYRQQMAALNKPALAISLDEILPPLGVILILMFLSGNGSSIALLALGCSSMLAVLIFKFLISQLTKPARNTKSIASQYKHWFHTSLFCLAGTLAKFLMNKTDVIMLAPLSSLEETGFYSAAFRITYILTFPQVALAMVVGPKISLAYSTDDPKRILKLLKFAYSFTVFSILIVTLPLLLFPKEILSLLYGRDYYSAANTLVALTASQAVSALLIPTTTLAMMTSFEKRQGLVTVACLALNVALNFSLIPKYGAFGAAIASLISISTLLILQKSLILRPFLLNLRKPA